jgi:hypothetical protein
VRILPVVVVRGNDGPNELLGHFRFPTVAFQMKRAICVSFETPPAGGETRCLRTPPRIHATRPQ